MTLNPTAKYDVFLSYSRADTERVAPPLPPWDFQGEITERETSMPIAGVEIDILANGRVQASTQTDAQGRFDLRLPPPKPATIEVRIRKEGYEGEPAVKVPTDQPWNIDLTKQ